MSHKQAKAQRQRDARMFKDIGVIPGKGKYMVVDQARIDHPSFHDSYTEATEEAEARAKQCNGKVEVWMTLRVIPDALPEEKSE